MKKVTLGGERLGSGKKMDVQMHSYERSNHDLSYTWRSTMSAGTLVPFMKEVGLPGDTHDIELDCDVMTMPTVGPLFGSFKVQLDVFVCPIRLYQGLLHMNLLGVGLNMAQVQLPQLRLRGRRIDSAMIEEGIDIDNYHTNPSSIYAYLGMRGSMLNGSNNPQPFTNMIRSFNGVPYLAYWDIYKQYYANKQEEFGVVIHNELQRDATIDNIVMYGTSTNISLGNVNELTEGTYQQMGWTNALRLRINFDDNYSNSQMRFFVDNGLIAWRSLIDGSNQWLQLNQMFGTIIYGEAFVELSNPINYLNLTHIPISFWGNVYVPNIIDPTMPQAIKLKTFPLSNIDKMRKLILSKVNDPLAFQINHGSDVAELEPYNLIDKGVTLPNGWTRFAKEFSQEGLGIKCYQSDLFNNWLNMEDINSINTRSRVQVQGGSFSIDALNLNMKVYNLLNRIAVSGGTYDDWLDATYTHERSRGVENPMYVGGLIKELVFQEVINTSATEGEPLGSLAGKGRMSDKHKGGKCIVRIDEPSYIMGIVSITPRIDYSQGNAWDSNLRTLDDFHKPAFDEIGFQDLIVDQMAWWTTQTPPTGGGLSFKSAGKQPAWINYMTNVNKCYGNFAIANNQMFMTLNRRYEAEIRINGNNNFIADILDLTTYIDPSKFNYIFADTRLDAQNFWVQIRVENMARRKMSAKVIPNL